MMKMNHAKRKTRTHFKQVPLEVVQKIADRDRSETERARAGHVIVEPNSGKTEPYSVPLRSVRRDIELRSANRLR